MHTVRVGWLLALLLWLAAVSCLIYGARLEPNRRLTWDNQGLLWLSQGKQDYQQWDYRTNRWKRVTQKPSTSLSNTRSSIEVELLGKAELEGTLSRYRARLLRPDGQHDEVEFEFPTHPVPFGTHFVIERLKSKWIVLDLNDPAQQIRELPAAGAHGLQIIEGTNTFIHVDDSVKPLKLEVIELLDGGLTRPVTQWQIGTTGAELLSGGKVRSISADLSQIETRDAITGTILETMPVPAGVDRVSAQFYAFGDFLAEDTIDSGFSYQKIYDGVTGECLRMPPTQLQQIPRLAAHGLWLFIGSTSDGRGIATVYNSHSHAIVWQQTTGARCTGVFVDESHIGLADHRHGVTAQVIDHRDGGIVAHTQPWWWVVPLLIVCSIGLVGWTFGWVRAAPPQTTWAGIEVCLLVVLGLSPLLLRLSSTGSQLNIDRLLFPYLQGMFIAVAHVCGVWIVFGRRTRLLLRSLPMLGVLTALLILVTIVFAPPKVKTLWTLMINPMDYAWEGFALTVIPTSISMLGFVGLAAMNFRLRREIIPQGPVGSLRGQLPLRDIFLGVACAALLIAALKPLLNHLPSRLPVVEWDIIAVIGLAVVAHVGLLAVAFANNQRLFNLGNIVAAMLLVAIIAVPVIDFAEQIQLHWLATRWRKLLVGVATSLVWFQALLLFFRYRYRLRWESP